MNQDCVEYIKKYVNDQADHHFSDDFPIHKITDWIQDGFDSYCVKQHAEYLRLRKLGFYTSKELQEMEKE